MAGVSRRDFLLGSALGLSGTVLPPLMADGARASSAIDPRLRQDLRACMPKDALKRLQEGNASFAKAWVAARAAPPEQRMSMLASLWQDNCQIDPVALAQGQKPFAAILSCADSRVDPSWIFDCTSGELFQVRNAGNTAFNDAIASLEYAVSVLNTALVVVMGHSGCGAVKAAMASDPLTPLLEELVKPIRASLVSGDDLTMAIQGNARYAAAQLTARSALLNQQAMAGKLVIRSAHFDIASGAVRWL